MGDLVENLMKFHNYVGDVRGDIVRNIMEVYTPAIV